MTIKEALPMINTGIIALFVVLFGLQYNQNKNLKASIQNLQNNFNKQQNLISEEDQDKLNFILYGDCTYEQNDNYEYVPTTIEERMRTVIVSSDNSNEGLNNICQKDWPLKDGYKYQYREDCEDKSMSMREEALFRKWGINGVEEMVVIVDENNNIVNNNIFNSILKDNEQN